MTSAVTVSEVCRQEYQALKLGKHKYVIFNLSEDNTEIVVEKVSSSAEYEDFIADLPETECRWGVYDFEYETEAGKQKELVFVSWSPDAAKIKQKMLFAASQEELRRSLKDIAIDIKGIELSEVAYESVLGKARRGN
ncbi:actin-binding ADF family protein [Streptomyces youssoufiensis]